MVLKVCLCEYMKVNEWSFGLILGFQVNERECLLKFANLVQGSQTTCKVLLAEPLSVVSVQPRNQILNLLNCQYESRV